MRIFAGLSRTDYEEVFRSIGALVDERGWTNVTLMEVEEGLIVQATPKLSYKETTPRLETYLLTDADIERVMREAVLRRQQVMAQVLSVAEADPPAAASPAPVAQAEEPVAAGHTEAAHPAWGAEPTNWRDNTDDPPLPSFDELAGDAPGAPEPLPGDFGLTPFDPFAPMTFSAPTVQEKTKPELDLGAARAAVVMAHIVAARLKSGVPMTGDDPDLASLLEQVQALDEGNIGEE